jgi:glycosyltransferase involved in cell wall biosynthesis
VRRALCGVAADVVVVLVLPFSLLGAATMAKVPLIVDYRDPWSARHTPPPLTRVTRTIERHAVRQAAAVVYAGAPALGDLLIRHLHLSPNRVIRVPNGFDPADIDGLSGAQLHPERNGQPLQLVMNGYWYGRNGPGILCDALHRVGPAVAQLTVIGGVSPPIAAQLTRAAGQPPVLHTTQSRRELYERLQRADAAVVTIDYTSAVESRIPAKIYDYLATGVPIIAVCPPEAALLQTPEARRFHHIHHRDVNGFVTLLRQALRDRATLCTGRLGEGPTREPGVETLHVTLRELLPGT